MQVVLESKFSLGDKVKVVTEYIDNYLERIDLKTFDATVVDVNFVNGFEYLVERKNKERIWIGQRFCKHC